MASAVFGSQRGPAWQVYRGCSMEPGFGAGLFGEELTKVAEGFELKCVAGGVEEEHRGLLADLAFKAGVGLDDEGDARSADALGELLPLGLGEDDAEVRDGNVVTIDGIAREAGEVAGRSAGFVVRDDLVPEEIEVDPMLRAPSFRAAENRAVEVAGGGEVIDREGDVEGTLDHTPDDTEAAGMLTSVRRLGVWVRWR